MRRVVQGTKRLIVASRLVPEGDDLPLPGRETQGNFWGDPFVGEEEEETRLAVVNLSLQTRCRPDQLYLMYCVGHDS